jgi:hypothetical protein
MRFTSDIILLLPQEFVDGPIRDLFTDIGTGRYNRHGLVAQILVDGNSITESFLAIIQQLENTSPTEKFCQALGK